MDPPRHIWNPILCSLHLVFRSPSSNGEAIGSGSTYTGTSTIRYRHEPYGEPSKLSSLTGNDVPTDATSASEYQDFVNHRRTVAQKHGLHLHALTTAGGIYRDAKVLRVESYQVAVVSSPSGGFNGTRKVISVVQEDASAAAAVSEASSTVSRKKNSARNDGGGKQKPNGRDNKNGSPTGSGAAGSVEASAEVDWGSKLVLFEDAEALPVYTEVELAISFTGTVQSHDHGGIYAARMLDSTASGSAEQAPLLTHLEVRFARCAFPCPDDPQYRLDWQLKMLQLPDTFFTVLTNGDECGRRKLPAQQAMQWNFAPCGPLPAYAFSFACFPDQGRSSDDVADGECGLEVVETVMDIPEAAADVTRNVEDSASNGSPIRIPVRILARRQACIPMKTLQRVLRVTTESVAELQRLFRCPLPLLQCHHLDVLLGPTMPYISGMEHHCSIILNESIYQPQGKGASSGNVEVEQTELIVHELTHHWIGNALGLPFAVKEGICQVVEQCVGDVLLGKPMRKYKVDQLHNNAGGPAAAQGSPAAVMGTKSPKAAIPASEKGHEFTGASYQHALSAIKRLVAEHGFDAFVRGLRHLLHELVVIPALAMEEQGGLLTLRCMGADISPPPYLNIADFLSIMETSQ